ncbi:polyphosphate polymerase domain-containing protein [Paenibacillus dokdonensis]|nr:polyphosphate polymerase domain-containing protein [Paenibacillus dokdonensis]
MNLPNMATGQPAVIGRRELKHVITQLDCHLLRHNLQHVMTLDPHAKKDGKYLIRSVYFDNFDNKALNQKKEGLFHRDKYRVRLYDYDTSFINLEKKSKRDNLCYKEKCSMTAEEYTRLNNGDIAWMEEDKRPLMRELYTHMNLFQLKPVVVVDYAREVYIYEQGNVRVTFDSQVRTSYKDTDILNPDLIMVDTVDPNTVILEVKYDEYLPDVIKLLLQVRDSRKTSFSKYQYSRMYG